MVSYIWRGKNIARSLKYNEQKVKQGKAVCLGAVNFFKDLERMNFDDKLWHFERLTLLNERTTRNCLHISINFYPFERFDDEKLKKIVYAYMQKIGLGDQPYLAYRHDDAAHPHVHLVSTTIREDGKSIGLPYFKGLKFKKVIEDIDLEFGLQHANSQKLVEASKPTPSPAQKVIYGKTEMMRGISNVLIQVIGQYKFASLEQFNVILRLYNVVADNGGRNSFLHRRRGLLYRILDEKGRRIGLPIKASLFPFKPTIGNLEKKFGENELLKAGHQRGVKVNIDWQLAGPKAGMRALVKALARNRISTVLIQNRQGAIDDIAFIDHQEECAFTGRDLGERYNLDAILERCGEPHPLRLSQKGPRREMYILPENLEYAISPGQDLGAVRSERQKTSPQEILAEGLKTEKDEALQAVPVEMSERKRMRQSPSNHL